MRRVTECYHRLWMPRHRRDRVCGRYHRRAGSCIRRYRGSHRFVVLGVTECQTLASSQPHAVIPPVNLPTTKITLPGQNLWLPTPPSRLPCLPSARGRRLPKPDGSSLLGGHVDSKSYRRRDRRRAGRTTGISRFIRGGRRIRLSGWVEGRSRPRSARRRHV